MAIQKVLCVDDVDTDLKNMEQVCTEAGYQVITAKNGNDAVSMARSEQPDAILLDVIMPDMNGFQVCRVLTNDEETKNIPIVLVSSKGEKTDRLWGEEQGAKGYIAKPYTAEQLVDQLKAL